MATLTPDTGFLNLCLGGTGALAAEPLKELWRADGRLFHQYSVLIDTDTANEHLKEEGFVEASIPVRLAYEQLQTVKATPGRFGPRVPVIIEEVAAMLDPEEMENGARTTRCLAQLLWEVRSNEIADGINRSIRDFLRRTACKRIIPFAATSSGGGTGSAFSILLGAALKEPRFRSRALQGFPDDLLRTLNLVVVEPFYRAFANVDDPNHTARILANAMAFRIESAYLECRGCFNMICHLGLSSPGGGVVLDSAREVSRVLGTTLFQYQKYWSREIKPRRVDRPLNAHYLGEDTPENVLCHFASAGRGQNGVPSSYEEPV